VTNFFPKQIRKRDGRIVDFDITRISDAIYKAMEAAGQPNRKSAKELAEAVVRLLVKKHKKTPKFIPSIEEIQDLVEETLIEKGYAKVAKVYILYRQKRAEIRQEKQEILNKEEIDEVDKRFDINALRVLKSRYLRKDDKGKVIESPKQLFERVAVHAALPEIIYDSRVTIEQPHISPEKINNDEKISDEQAEQLEGKLFLGKYKLNRFHIKGLHYLFIRFAKAKQTKPDAIILDVMMSYDSEGFDIARKLREDNITKDIPIVMITGIRKTKSLPFSYEPDPDWLPVNEVLEKPIKPDQILNALEKALKK